MNRRSIYPAQFKEETINDEVIWSILTDANQAPSHKNTEPWRFQVFAGSAKATLGDQLAEAYKTHMPVDKFSAFKQNKITKKPRISSHVIAIIMQRDPEERLPEWEEIAAVSCAVQNIYLSCTMRGLGCYWSSPAFLCETPSLLNLPEGQRCLGLLYLGVPKDDLEFDIIKGDIKDKVVWFD